MFKFNPRLKRIAKRKFNIGLSINESVIINILSNLEKSIKEDNYNYADLTHLEFLTVTLFNIMEEANKINVNLTFQEASNIYLIEICEDVINTNQGNTEKATRTLFNLTGANGINNLNQITELV